MPEFPVPDEVFIISDLHVGGEYASTPGDRGFRINTHMSELAGFVEEIRSRAARTRLKTELVINGDFVDFLAEKGPDPIHPWRAFIADENEAVETLVAVADRDRVLFAALGELIRSGVAVTLLLGNHDVELSLPAVREELRQQLGIGHGQAFHFIYDGEAYVIGDVLIEHGNRNDEWNSIDFDKLRRYRSILSRRQERFPDAEFYPPPGSRLVERIMNPIKVDYPFIDLLKPETEAAIPLLLALEPSYARDIDTIEAFDQLWSDAANHRPRAGDSVGEGEHRWTRLDSRVGAQTC